MSQSLYDAIGVLPSATQEEIEAACIRLGEELNPANKHGNLQAAIRFKEIEKAYEILSNPEKRRQYDEESVSTHKLIKHHSINAPQVLGMSTLIAQATGKDGRMALFDDKVVISREGVSRFMTLHRGNKDIPLSEITAVQFRECSKWQGGYLQLSVVGGVEWKGGFFAANSWYAVTQDENAIVFGTSDPRALWGSKIDNINAEWRFLKAEIESRLEKASSSPKETGHMMAAAEGKKSRVPLTVSIVLISIIGGWFLLRNSGPAKNLSPMPDADSRPNAVLFAHKTTAETLFSDYESNEVATDETVKNFGAIVSGTVTEIRMDLSGSAVIGLKTRNQFMSAMMTMEDTEKDKAKYISKGDSVTVYCQRMSRFMGSPTGGKCVFFK